MRKLPILQKSLAVCLALVVLLFGGCAAKQTDDSGDAAKDAQTEAVRYQTRATNVRKTETVYVQLDATGAPTKTTVSDWLHTDTAETYIQDKSDLQDIVNVKGDSAPTVQNDALIWNMPTTDLYYQGTCDKTLPVSFQIQYFLNGEAVAAEDLAGKSGQVQIQVKMINNFSEERTINGEKVRVYNPVIALGGMILPESQFQSVTLDNGEVIGDGSKEIVLMVGMPGMNETLGMDSLDLDDTTLRFEDTFTVTMQATDFTLGNLYFAVLPLSTLGSIQMPKSVEELKNTLNQIKQLETVMKTIDPQNIISTLMGDPEKLASLTSMLSEAVSLYQDNQALLTVLSKYMTEENVQAIQNLAGTDSGSSSTSLVSMLKLLADPEVQQFLKLLPTASGDLVKLLPALQGLSKELQDPEVQKQLDALPKTIEQLTALQQDLEKNQDTINALTTLMSAQNMAKLSDIMDSADTASFADKLEQYGVLADNADGLLSRTAEMLSYGNNFKIYSEASADTETSVMYIYKTPSVQKAAVTETQPAQEEKSWFEELFGK